MSPGGYRREKEGRGRTSSEPRVSLFENIFENLLVRARLVSVVTGESLDERREQVKEACGRQRARKRIGDSD